MSNARTSKIDGLDCPECMCSVSILVVVRCDANDVCLEQVLRKSSV